MRTETEFSIFLINRPGVLAGVTSALARAKVNIIALTLGDSGEHGVLRIIADHPAVARDVLGKAHDRWAESEVLVLELENRPGAFASVAQKLADEHVNIGYAYCTGGARGGRTTAVFKVNDLIHASRALAEYRHDDAKAAATVKTSPQRGRG
ncbi:MAG: ACT domain-containing protein [Phycisphaerae bacterium]|nr:ACT domain-containing protein [Phycisphaerae bacterium]